MQHLLNNYRTADDKLCNLLTGGLILLATALTGILAEVLG